MGKLAHKLQTEALKLVFLYQLVEVDREELERDADVVTEDETVVQVNHVHLVVLVLFLEMFQDLYLLLSLTVKTWLIANHLERHVDVVLMVVGLHHLAKAALANDFEHLVAVGDVVVDNMNVRVLLVVVARIVRRHDGPFLRHGSNEVDVRVVKDLLALVGRQHVAEVLEHLLWLTRLGFRFGHNAIAGTVALARLRRALLRLRRRAVARHI